jgi:hypothetical protein
MKFVALFLTACILFLSTTGMVKPVEQSSGKKTCCHKTAGISAAQMKKMQERHHKDCPKEGCTMLFSCTLCGFLVVEPLTIISHSFNYIEKPVSLYKVGDLSAYHPFGWKPPKAC